MVRRRETVFSPQQELIGLGALYLGAFLLRLPILPSLPYGDEGMFFHVAQRWWNPPPFLDDIYDDPVHPYLPFLFFHRPFFHVLMRPAASISFEAYRFFHILLTALLAPLATMILRQSGVRKRLAYPAGALIAASPALLAWNVFLWPDSLMTLLLAMSLWFALRRQGLWAGIFAVAAVWTKETAFAAVAFLLGYALWEGWRERRTTVWPLRFDTVQSGYAVAFAIAPFPLAIAMGLGLGFPGGPSDTNYAPRLLDGLFLTLWLLPALLVGLTWRRSRMLAFLGLLYPVVYLALHLLLHRGVEGWYMVPANYFVVLGAALALDEAWRRGDRTRRRPHCCIAPYAAVLLAALLAFHVLGPATPVKGRLLHPVTGQAEGSVFQVYDYELHRSPNLRAVLDVLDARRPHTVMMVDVYLPTALYPLSSKSEKQLGWGTLITQSFHQDLIPWVTAIEDRSNLTLVEKHEHALNLAIRSTYADCLIHDNFEFAVIDGPGCRGRGDALRTEYEARLEEARP